MLVAMPVVGQMDWKNVTPSAGNPPARRYHAMAYDAARQQILLYGGLVNSGGLDDTWVWNGMNWTQHKLSTNPMRRRAHAMAYDAARQQVVLFGGCLSGTDTWMWDGKNWTDVTPKAPKVSPSARLGHAMAYDAARQREHVHAR